LEPGSQRSPTLLTGFRGVCGRAGEGRKSREEKRGKRDGKGKKKGGHWVFRGLTDACAGSGQK